MGCFAKSLTVPVSEDNLIFWTDELLSKRVADRMQAGVEVYGVWDQLGAAHVSF